MKAAFDARVNLITQVANFSCLELGQKPRKKSLACSALKGANQHLNKVIRENSCNRRQNC